MYCSRYKMICNMLCNDVNYPVWYFPVLCYKMRVMWQDHGSEVSCKILLKFYIVTVTYQHYQHQHVVIYNDSTTAFSQIGTLKNIFSTGKKTWTTNRTPQKDGTKAMGGCVAGEFSGKKMAVIADTSSTRFANYTIERWKYTYIPQTLLWVEVGKGHNSMRAHIWEHKW